MTDGTPDDPDDLDELRQSIGPVTDFWENIEPQLSPIHLPRATDDTEAKLVDGILEEAVRRVTPLRSRTEGSVAGSTGVRPELLSYFRSRSTLASVVQGEGAPSRAFDDIFDGTSMSATQALAKLNRWLIVPGRTSADIIELLRGPLADIVEDSERAAPDAWEARGDLIVTAVRLLPDLTVAEDVLWRLAGVTEDHIDGWGIVQTAANIANSFDVLPGSDTVPSLVLTHRVVRVLMARVLDGTLRPIRPSTVSSITANVGIGINMAAQRRDADDLGRRGADLVTLMLRMAAVSSVNPIDPRTERIFWARVDVDLPVGSLNAASEIAAGNQALAAQWSSGQTAVFQLFNAAAQTVVGSYGDATSSLFNVGVTLLDSGSDAAPETETIDARLLVNAAGAWIAVATSRDEVEAARNAGFISCLFNLVGTLGQQQRRRGRAGTIGALTTEVGRLARSERLRLVRDQRIAEDLGRLQSAGRRYGDDVPFSMDRLAEALGAYLDVWDAGPATHDGPVVAEEGTLAAEPRVRAGMWALDDSGLVSWLTDVTSRVLAMVQRSPGADLEAVKRTLEELVAAQVDEPTMVEALMAEWERASERSLADWLSDLVPADRIAEIEARVEAEKGSLAPALRALPPAQRRV